MPTIPVIQDRAQLETGTGRSRVTASPDAFGAQEAQASQSFAQSLSRVSQGLGQVAVAAEEIDQRFDEANARDLDTRLSEFEREAMHNPDTGFMTLRGRNALDARDGLRQNYDRQIEEIAAGARSDRARAAFTEAATRRRDSAFTRVDQYSSDQFRVYENDVSEARLSAAGRSALAAPFDDMEVLRNVGVIDEEARLFGTRNGMGPEVVEEMVNQQRGEIAGQIWELRAQRDPRGVRGLLTREGSEGVLLQSLTPVQRARLVEGIDRELERRAAAWRTQVREQISAASDMWEIGEQAVNAPSVATVRSALGDNAAAAYEIRRETFDAASRMNGLPNGELERMAVAAPTTEGTRTERAVRGAQRRAAAEILQRRNSDPMADAARSGQVNTDAMFAAIQEGAFDRVGRQLRSRAAVARENAERLGVRPDPLTNIEAAAIRGTLDRLTPDQRMAALREMGGGSMTPHARAAIEQIYADNAPARMGALLLGRRGSIQGAEGRIDGATVGRRMINGAHLLRPPTEEQSGEGESRRQPRARIDMPSDGALRAAWINVVGDAYAGMPEAQERAYEAYRSYFAGAIAERGLNGASLTTSNGVPSGDDAVVALAAEAARAAAGEIRQNPGNNLRSFSRTIIPWGMSVETFEDGIAQSWPTIREAFPNSDISTRSSRDFGYAFERSDGRYNYYRVMDRGAPAEANGGGPITIRLPIAR